jgi:hypothetical protein
VIYGDPAQSGFAADSIDDVPHWQQAIEKAATFVKMGKKSGKRKKGAVITTAIATATARGVDDDNA